MAEFTELDQVWLVVTPHNPLKDKSTLLNDRSRYRLVQEAIDDNPKLKVTDVEFNLPKPSYTITTLTYLIEKHPEFEFSLIMGEDNLRTFHKWFNHEIILKKHKLFVYPRVLTLQEEQEVHSISRDFLNNYRTHENVVICEDAPVMKVSSSFIREAIKKGKDVRYLLTDPVYKYIDEMNLYK
jgi:nicotinate-nucleotide adenylyltransferase